MLLIISFFYIYKLVDIYSNLGNTFQTTQPKIIKNPVLKVNT